MRAAADQIAAEFAEFDRADSPGATVAVIRDGEIVETASFGRASLEHGVPNRRETVFYIASVSKQFVACAVVLLESDGAISLDDTVGSYVPEVAALGDVRIHHLLHHTSGIRDKYSLALIGRLPEEAYATDPGSLHLLAGQRTLNFPSGTRHLYSNSGYFLLAQIVARVAGEPLSEFAEKRIFSPLGMSNTVFRDDPSLVIAKRASGYRRGHDGSWRLAEYTWPSLGAGGVFTTVDDLARWDAAMYGGVLDPPNLHELMLRTRPLADGRPNNYACGLMVHSHRGRRLVSHGGGVAGYSAEILRFPDLRCSVICLANSSAVGATVRAHHVADLVLADELDAEPEKAAPAAVEADASATPGLYCSVDETLIAELVKSEDGFLLRVGTQQIPLAVAGPSTLSTPMGFDVLCDENGFTLRQSDSEDEGTRFAWIDPAPPGVPLDEFVGTFRSPELDVRVTTELDDGTLRISHPARRPAELRRVTEQLFVFESSLSGIGVDVVVRFEPDALVMNEGRGFGVRFEREADAA